jgi:hypothetical protein
LRTLEVFTSATCEASLFDPIEILTNEVRGVSICASGIALDVMIGAR